MSSQLHSYLPTYSKRFFNTKVPKFGADKNVAAVERLAAAVAAMQAQSECL